MKEVGDAGCPRQGGVLWTGRGRGTCCPRNGGVWWICVDCGVGCPRKRGVWWTCVGSGAKLSTKTRCFVDKWCFGCRLSTERAGSVDGLVEAVREVGPFLSLLYILYAEGLALRQPFFASSMSYVMQNLSENPCFFKMGGG